MGDAMSALFEVAGARTETPQRRWTERDMLDLLRERYTVDAGNGPRYVLSEHVRNQGGFGRDERLRTVDALAIDLWPSSGYLIHGFEVKVSRGDWLTELRDPSKADAFKRYCHHWWLVVPDKQIAHDGVPDGWGLLATGKNGRLRVVRRAPKLKPEPVSPGLLAAWLRAASKRRDP